MSEVIVIGSGFGGSVAALRLAQKGYRVTVLETGRRFADEEFASRPWQLHRMLWAPRLGLHGILRIRLRRNLLAISGAGLGGGSLAYAGVHYRPDEDAFQEPGWPAGVDWAGELAPYFDVAERMLGTTTVPGQARPGAGERVLHEIGEALGARAHPVRAGIHFGPPQQMLADPYFAGQGPARTGCTLCGSCVTGCRQGAKNTLTKNYLHLAEQLGARLRPMTTVTALSPRPGGGWTVRTAPSTPGRRRAETLSADHVVLAAGAWGTTELLHRARAAGALPDLSLALGTRVCTNRGVPLAAAAPHFDVGPGIAISSAVRPTPSTLVQLCRVGPGTAPLAAAFASLTGPPGPGQTPPARRFEQHTALLFAMERSNSVLTSRYRRGRLTFITPDNTKPTSLRMPAAEDVARAYASQIGGRAYTWWPSRLLRMPVTVHQLGGCPLGEDPQTSVADLQHRVHGYPTLHLSDASVITANLGVNPSLTITAMAERAMSHWPDA
jgi:cholesterol oxidase